MLIDDDDWSALEPPPLQLSASSAPPVAADGSEPHVLDSWQSGGDGIDAPLVLVAKHVPQRGCERCVVSVDGQVQLSTRNVRRTSDITVECFFRQSWSVEAFHDDVWLRAHAHRAVASIEVLLDGGRRVVLPSSAHVNMTHLLLLWSPEAPSSPPVQRFSLCACTQIKNRNAYVREWMAFHELVGGVEAFFFYRNGGQRLDEAVLPFLDAGVAVDVRFWPHVRSQRQAFAHCLARMRDVCDWALFVDVDEFVVPTVHNATLRRLLATVANDVIEFPARVFCAGNETASAGLVIESAVRYFAPTTQVSAKKSVVRTAAAKLSNSIHTFELARAHRSPSAVCGPTCAGALATLNHFRFVSWPLFMRRVLDGAAGDVGLARVPRLLSVLRPSQTFEREATLATPDRFVHTDERLLAYAGAVRARLDALQRQAPTERTRAIREQLARRPVRASVDEAAVARATLTAAEASAVLRDASVLEELVARGRHFTRVAPNGTPLAVLLLPQA